MFQSNKKNKVHGILNKIHSKLKLKNFLIDLDKDQIFLDQINQKISLNKIFKKRKFESIYEFSVYRNFIYSLIRNQKPSIVLETGVLHGLTSAWILKALKDNKKGKLISIDLPRRDWEKFFGKKPFGPGGNAEFELKSEIPGWIIPDELKNSWELNLGPSSEFLEKILNKNKEIELFIHDSDHSYEVMKYECDLVQKHFDNIDIIIDDYYCNEYYKEFSKNFEREYHFIDDVDDNHNLVQGSLYYPKRSLN